VNSARQIFSISKLTMLEIIRQPISLLLFTFCLLFSAALPLLASHTLGETQSLVIDSSLAMQFATGLLLGAYAACSTLTREMRSGTAAAILSKPVWRPIFFLAKYLGIVYVMLLFSLGAALTAVVSAKTASEPFWVDKLSAISIMGAFPLAYLIAALINFKRRRPFASNAFAWLLILVALVFVLNGFVDRDLKLSAFAANYRLEIMPASLLVATAILVLCALALSLATRLDMVPTISICATVFLLGLMSDYLFGRFADSNPLAYLCYHIVPNWQHFWVTDALRDKISIPWNYIAGAAGYALLYIGGCLLLGVNAFRKIEME
jgi:hypothetical protein